MKIAFFLAEAWEREMLESDALAREHDCQYFLQPLDHEHIPDDMSFDVVCVFIDSVVDRAMVDRLPNVKLIATRSTGFDHIDLEACNERGIAVANVPTYGSNTVAEHAFALLLSLSKRIFDGYEQVREGRGFNPHRLRGFDLCGRTLGVIGTGNIGRYAIKIGQGFSMDVIAYDAFPDESFAEESGFRYVDLDTLIQTSDVLTLHVPYLPATHHLLNSQNLAQLKDGAVIINTSRGQVVETAALVTALESGKLRGAGLDVCEEEGTIKDEIHFFSKPHEDKEQLQTLLANHILIDHPNVIITPHSAFNTDEALRRIMHTTVENIMAFASGEPTNTVA